MKGEIQNAKDYIDARNDVINKYNNTEDKRVVVFDDEFFSSTIRSSVLLEFEEPIYVVYPDTGRDCWRVKTVQEDENGFSMRKPLPESWSGLKDEDLVKMSGIDDATFCHRALFTCSAKTKEGAIKMAYKALEQ